MSAKLDRIAKACPGCGKSFEVTTSMLERGRGKHCSRACGAKVNSLKHGHTTHSSQSPTYVTWVNMIRRCQDKKSTKYPSYGAMGITVCAEWQIFEAFLSDMGERPSGTTLDRIDGSAGYSASNCRWATPAQQSANLKTTVWTCYDGEKITISDLAKKLGLEKSTLAYRIKSGWPEGRLADKPNHGSRPS